MAERKRDVLGQIDRSHPTVEVPAYMRNRDPDPLDVTTTAGYDVPPTRPRLVDERPVVDDRGMVLVWIVAALAFVATLALTLLAVAPRPAGG